MALYNGRRTGAKKPPWLKSPAAWRLSDAPVPLRKGDKVVADLDGAIFPGIDAAREEATASAREMMINAIMSANEPPDCIKVCDSNGETALQLFWRTC